MPSRRFQDQFLWSNPELGLPMGTQLPYTEDFTGTNNDPWNPVWFNQTGSAGWDIDINSNRGRLVTGTLGGYADYTTAVREHFQSDVDITVLARYTTITECYPRIYFRADQSGNRYFVQMEPAWGYVRIIRDDAYSGTIIKTVTTGFSPTLNSSFRFRILAYGTLIKVKWWADGGSEPGTWNMEISDRPSTAHNGTLLYLSLGGPSAASSVSVEWDDLTVAAAAAPSYSSVLDLEGLTLWADATQETLSNGDPVATWVNRKSEESGHALVQGTSGARPTFRSSMFGSLPGIDFDGTDDFLESQETTATLLDTTQSTVIVVFKANSIGTSSGTAADNDAVWQEGNGNAGATLTSTGPSILAHNWDGNEDQVSSSITVGSTHIHTWRHVGNTLYASIDGGAESSVASSTTGGGGSFPLYVGSNYTTSFADVTVGELIVVERALTTTELAAVVADLEAKWVSTPATNAPAGLASATGSGQNATAAPKAAPTLATATSTAYNPSTIVRPQAAAPSATSTSFAPLVAIRSYPDTPTASGTAYGVSIPPTDATNAGVASRWSILTQVSLGSIKGPNSFGAGRADRQWAARLVTFVGSASTNALAGAASGSGSAFDAVAAVRPQSQAPSASGTAYGLQATLLVAGTSTATATGTAQSSPSRTSPSATLATASGTSQTPLVTVRSTGGLATATSTSLDAVDGLKPQAQAASGSGAAYNATTQSVSNTNAPAGLATATAAGYDAVVRVSPAPSAPSATGAAYGVTTARSVLAQVATASGTVPSPVALVAPNAATIAATGAAYGAVARPAPSAGLATGSGTAYGSAAILITFTSGSGSATGTAHNPVWSVSDTGNAEVATASGTAYQVSRITISFAAGLASATATMHDADPLVSAAPPAASGSGSALGGATHVQAVPQVATGVGTAYDASTDELAITYANAGPITATSAAHDTQAILITFAAGVATATGAGANPAALVAPPAALASASGTAHDAGVSISDIGDAGSATGTSTAQSPSATVRPSSQAATATGTAYNASAATYPVVLAPVGLASATSTAQTPAARVSPAPPVIAATGAALAPLIALRPQAPLATATGAAQTVTASDGASSTIGSGSGTSQPAGAGLRPQAGLATAAGTAYNASVSVAEYVTAAAQTATATSAAYAVTSNRGQDLGVATLLYTATELTATGGATSTDVTAAATTWAAQDLTVTASMVMLDLPTATTTWEAQAFTVTQGNAAIDLPTATTTWAGQTLTASIDISLLVDHHAAALGFMSVGQRTLVIPSGALDDKDRPWAVRLYDRNVLIAPITPATTTWSGQDLVASTGPISLDLGTATTTFTASTFGVNGQEVDLAPATVTLQGQMFLPIGSPITVDIGTATLTATASALEPTTAQHLGAATITVTAQNLVAEVGKGPASQFFPQPLRVTQSLLTSGNTLLYTVPVGQFLVIKQVTLQKVAANPSAVRLWSVPSAATLATEHAFMYDVDVVGAIDQEMSMVLGPGDKLYGRCATAATVACRVDGYLLATKSLPTPKVFFQGMLSASYAEVAVTSTANKGLVKFISIANTSAVDRTVDISVTTTGVAPSDDGAIRRALSIPANTSVFIPMTMVLAQNEALAVKADQAGVVALNVAGVIG